MSVAPKTQKSVLQVTGWSAEITTRLDNRAPSGIMRVVLVADLFNLNGELELTVEAMSDQDLRFAALDAIELIEAEAKAGECLV